MDSTTVKMRRKTSTTQLKRAMLEGGGSSTSGVVSHSISLYLGGWAPYLHLSQHATHAREGMRTTRLTSRWVVMASKRIQAGTGLGTVCVCE